MNFKRLFISFTLSVFIVSTIAAQTPSPQDATKANEAKTDQEKAQEALRKKALALLDEVLKEAAGLRLAENRIRIQLVAAGLLWKYDEKRARDLFKQVTDSYVELLAGEDGASTSEAAPTTEGFQVATLGRYPMGHFERNSGLLQVRYQLRQEILELLTNRDPRLAREFMLKTFQLFSRDPQVYSNTNGEVVIEMNLAAQMVATDPKQALEIVEEHLEKGFPYGLANVLFQLRTKDREATVKLLAEIMKKLRTENLASNQEAATLVLQLLEMEGEPDDAGSSSDGARTAPTIQPVLDEKTKRELMSMWATAALNQSVRKPGETEVENPDQPPLIASFEMMIPKFEKYAPAHLPALRKKFAEYKSALPPQPRGYKEYEALVQNGDPQAMVDAAAKVSPELKDRLLIQAIMKVSGENEFDRARQMINEHIKDAGQRMQMLMNLDRQILQHATMQGKLDEARLRLSRLPLEERVTWLIQFGEAAIGRGDKKLGLQIMDEARGLLGLQAENNTELNALLYLARSYAPIEPARSFDIIEPIVEQLNLLLSALVSIDGFESWQQFKDGELIATGSSVIANTTMQCARDLALLSRADFDRAKSAADRFDRVEVRMTARLFIVQGVLSN